MENNLQVNRAISLTNSLISLLNDAESNLSSARNWGFLDILGGGLLTDLIKHSKLNKASQSMQEVNYLMQELQHALGSIQIPQDYSMNVGGFETFADFVFDGAIVDIYMTSKIMSSLNEVKELKARLFELKRRLERI